jgi:hypothetical protein
MNKRSTIVTRQSRSPRSLSTSDTSAAACSAHTRLKTPVARRSGKSSVSWKQEPPDRNRFGSLTAYTRHYSTSAGSHSVFMRGRMRLDLSHVVYVVHNANGLLRRTRTYAAWIQHACASRDHADQRGAVSRRFPKKKFSDPPSSKVEKGGVRTCVRKKLFPKIASPVAPRRSGPSQESDTGALSIPTFEIDAAAACTLDATQAMLTEGRARGRAHGDLHQWRRGWRVWIRSRGSRIQKIAGSRCGCGSGVGYDARKWRGWSMRSILDHRETAAGVCHLPRTL